MGLEKEVTVETTHRATKENGPSVVEGRLLWTSASGITTADHNSFGGCTLSWWYDKVGGYATEETDAMRRGTVLHNEVQDHLTTGASLTSPLALAGRMFIPHPGSGLLIEKPIHFVASSGVHIYGHVDLYNFRQQYVDPEGVLQADPAWSFEVKDWKTTSSFQYAKSERELGENIQLNTYAEAGFREWPDLEHARLTHAYFLTRGRPDSKLVTIRRSREEIARRWEYSESVIRRMVDAAKEAEPNQALANRKSCDAYKGCPHRGVCVAYRANSLDALYGKIATDFTQETAPMGLLSSNPQIMQPQTTTQQHPQGNADELRAALAREEATMRAQAAQQQAQMPQANQGAQLAEVCSRISSYGFGFPSLGENAAQAYAAMGGQRVPPGFVYQGIPAPAGAARSMHGIVLKEVQNLFQLESELAAERAKSAPAPQQIQYTMPVQTAVFTIPPAALAAKFEGEIPYNGILPPGAPESMPQLAMQHPSGAPPAVGGVGDVPYVLGSEPAATPAAPEAPKKGRGRPKKTEVLDSAPEAVAAAPEPPPAGVPASPAPPAAPSASTPIDAVRTDVRSCSIFVNARCYGVETTSLASYVDYINEKLSKMYSVTEDGRPGIQDVRCVPRASPLFANGWKGAVREVVKAEPPPEAAYHLDTMRDELKEIVADALRVVAERRGWQYVRGVSL
jgi:hypothetical protein